MKNIILIFAFMFVANISDAQSVIQRNKTKDKVEKTSRSTQSRSNPTPRKPNAPKVSRVNPNNENGHEWVDLGLSVKWATCNVGANNPSDFGGYYAWGEIITKSRYDWDNCFDCLDNSGSYWGFYKLGGQVRFNPYSGCDTARENCGGAWRVPTDEEFNELCAKCTWTWSSNNGANGYMVTGPNGKQIFLPAAGWRYGTEMNVNGENGYYWSNTLHPSHSHNASNLYFNKEDYYKNSNNRRYGLSVRPVID